MLYNTKSKGGIIMILIPPLMIALFNTLTIHTMLTRRRSIIYCIIAYILNSIVFVSSTIYIKYAITNPTVYKYAFYLAAFSYIIYITLVFKESFGIKLFSMFTIWVFSTIITLLPNMIYYSIATTKMNVYGSLATKLILQFLLLLFSYLWYGKQFKIIINKLHLKIVYLMCGYVMVAQLLLINSTSMSNQIFKNANSNIEMLLLMIFIILGYVIVFFGITSSSRNSLLKQDINTLKIESDSYYKLANYDFLTGIANRQSIIEQISKALSDSNNAKEKFVLFMFDIDKFKTINDQFGHVVGDKALRFLASRVKNCLREDDIIGRLGGDEFIIFSKKIQTKAEAESLIKRIIDTLETPLNIHEQLIYIKISIGVSVFPDDAKLMDDLLDQADKAMYRAKKRVGTTYEFYNEQQKF